MKTCLSPFFHDASKNAFNLHGALSLEVDEHTWLEILPGDRKYRAFRVALCVFPERSLFGISDR
jgi:hypothetical protein